MNLILIDIPEDRVKFFPLSLTRPISKLRIGIFTIAEKWRRSMQMPVSYYTIDYLSAKFPLSAGVNNICINSRIIPDQSLISAIDNLSQHEGLYKDDTFIACKVDKSVFEKKIKHFDFSNIKSIEYKAAIKQISRIADIYNDNPVELNSDMGLINNKNGGISDPHTVCYNSDQIFIGRNTNIKSCILDAESGPIFIDDRVTLNPGTVIIGPAAILHDTVISIGSKIRGNTTIGPYCKVGGEVNHVVFQGYSNKSHDGFLGSSVIGEWCNFGAGSNNSNLKNNYSGVKLWDYEAGKFSETGLQYCGLIMGDYSKCGINTMFNTGTVVGICANIFGNGYMPKFIPSFSWGNNEGFVDYNMEKAVETIKTVMKRRDKAFHKKDKAILQHIFDFTAKFRGRI
jgi:UDP-N-acetylglucosamine diphosphorylase/glucosamine-1-phosphate N-acetyltransferase